MVVLLSNGAVARKWRTLPGNTRGAMWILLAAFLATTMFVNSLVQAFFMPNAQEFGELVRTGGLDFALLKPIDTQFLISLQRVNWSSLINFLAGGILLAFSVSQLAIREEKPFQLTPLIVILYPIFVVCGVAILYSLMVSLAATLGDGPYQRTGGWENASNEFAGVISVAANYELTTLSWGNIWTPATGDPIEARKLASPVNHVHKEMKPLCIIHSDNDRSVPIDNALGMIKALKEMDIAHTFHRYPVAGHMGITEEVIKRSRDFIDAVETR